MAGLNLADQASLTEDQRRELARIFAMPDCKLAFDLDHEGGITYSAVMQGTGEVHCVWTITKDGLSAQQKNNIFAVMKDFNALRFGDEVDALPSFSSDFHEFVAKGDAGEFFLSQAEKQQHSAAEKEKKVPASPPPLDLSGGSCVTGCFAFRTTAALRKATGLKWSVAQDGSAYVASGDRLHLEALAEVMRWQLDDSVKDRDATIRVLGADKKNSTLHIARFACETGDFVAKVTQALDKDVQPTLSHAGFMNGLCAEQLEKLTSYRFTLVSDRDHPDKPSCAKAVLNADSARSLYKALVQYAGVDVRIKPLPYNDDTPQRDRKAELYVYGSRVALGKLKALRDNSDFKAEFDKLTLDHIAAATSAFRGKTG